MVENPVVSVIVVTYNHELFIEQNLQSILDQDTDFEYEVILANDSSPDNSDAIIKNFLDKHPRGYRVNYFVNNPNLGVMPNSKKALDLAKGKYLALCEGDDFWLDKKKLQKQVDFLEEHNDFAICFHNTRVDFFDQELPSYYVNEGIERDVFTLDDMIGQDEIWFMATASLLIRSSAYGKTPHWLLKSKSGDIPIIILAARNGKIKYLPEVMAVYRKNLGSFSHTDNYKEEHFLKNRIYMYSELDRETDYKYHKRLKRNIARYYFMLLDAHQIKGMYFMKLGIVFKYLSLTFPQVPNKKSLLRDHVIPAFVMNIFRGIKRIFGLAPNN
ncbi:MAG: glycosyltransferase involved in cell wall biosynthesis [Algoriphagus sp.]|jgi:glycosyltransferase involved in cell wall biosynthesis